MRVGQGNASLRLSVQGCEEFSLHTKQCQQVTNSGKGIVKCITYVRRARELQEDRGNMSSQQGSRSHPALLVPIHSPS